MARKKPTDWAHTGLRMREAMRAKLEAAAKTNGVSLNQEMLNRIERSFDRDHNERSLLGEGNRASFLRMLAAGLDIVEEDTRGKVFENDETTAQARAMMFNLFGLYRGIRNISNLAKHAGHDFPVAMDSVLSFLSVAYGIDRETARKYLGRPALPRGRPDLTIAEMAADLNVSVADIEDWVRFLGIELRETERGSVLFPGHRNWLWYIKQRRADGADYDVIREEIKIDLKGGEEAEAQYQRQREEHAAKRAALRAALEAEDRTAAAGRQAAITPPKEGSK